MSKALASHDQRFDVLDLGIQDITQAQRNRVLEAVWFDELKHELKETIHKQKIQLETYVQGWLYMRPEVTAAQYSTLLSLFLKWLAVKEIHAIDVTAKTIHAYIFHLKGQKLSDSSQRHHLQVLSSFYSYLFMEDVIIENPFIRAKKPKRISTKSLFDIPTSQDIAKIQRTIEQDIQSTEKKQGVYLRKRSAPFYYVILHLCCTYGFRVGGLPSLRIQEKGNQMYWSLRSKQQEYSGVLQKLSFDLLKHYGFQLFAPLAPSFSETDQRIILRVKKAFPRIIARTPGLSTTYSIHRFRDYFACKLYLDTKDVKRVQQALGHRNLTTTDRYLQGIDFTSPYFDLTHWGDLTWHHL